MKNKIEGVISALVTPFVNGAIDFDSFRRLIRAQLAGGVQGFVVNGTTGESPSLTAEEVDQLMRVAREEVKDKVPLIVGTGGNDTTKTVAATRAAAKWSPDATLVVVPYYNKPPQRGLVAHFSAVADASPAPVILYNVPSRTVANLEPKSVAELAKHPNIIGVKDATGDMNVLESLKAIANFTLLSGDDGTCVEFAARGGHGVISVASQVFPREMRASFEAARAADAAAAPAYAARFTPLINALYREANPIPVKMALNMMGLISSPELRLPLTTLDQRHHEELRTCLNTLSLM